jgi:hypothetical protein
VAAQPAQDFAAGVARTFQRVPVAELGELRDGALDVVQRFVQLANVDQGGCDMAERPGLLPQVADLQRDGKGQPARRHSRIHIPVAVALRPAEEVQQRGFRVSVTCGSCGGHGASRRCPPTDAADGRRRTSADPGPA